ncbi:MAG: ribonuclease P protein component 1 [Salinirussus sp.]
MAITPETVARHELVGLDAHVARSPNAALESLEGTVVDETRNTLELEDGDRVRRIPKDAALFEFTLPSGAVVTVEGDRLVADPARRTERRGDSPWR